MTSFVPNDTIYTRETFLNRNPYLKKQSTDIFYTGKVSFSKVYLKFGSPWV